MVVYRLHKGDTRVEVRDFGAHITSLFVSGSSVLFLSSKAILDGSKAIRGGIPICWPWFGKSEMSPLQHGFARLSTWRSVDVHDDRVTLELTENDVDDALLAGTGYSSSGFVVRYTVEILDSGGVKLMLSVRNGGEKALPPMTCALHSYFSIDSDITEAEVCLNAKDVAYVDQLRGTERLNNAKGVVATFGTEEIDRIFFDVHSSLDIVDKATTSRIVRIESDLPDAVVWNPYTEKSKIMSDFSDDEYLRMICVESAQIGHPVVVQKGGNWTCTVMIHAR